MRFAVPSVLSWCGLLGLVLAGWLVLMSWEDEQKLEALFQRDAEILDRVQSAETWARQGAQAIPRLKEALASPDNKTRYLGLLAFAYMAPQEARAALPEIIRLCDDPDPMIQADALVLAGNLSDDPEAIAPLIASRLISPEPKLSQAAGIALQRLGPAATSSIAAIRPQANPEVQVQCLNLLIHSISDKEHGPEAMSAISECLESPHLDLRRQAYQAAAAIRALTREEIATGLRDSELEIVKIAVTEWTADPERDPGALPQLLDLLRDQPSLRLLILEAIAAQGPSDFDVFPAVAAWADSEDPAIRQAALVALVRTTSDRERARPILLRRLADGSPQVARQAARLLARIAPSELPDIVRDLLMPRVDSGQESVQIAAIAALSGMPEAAASERISLIRMLSVVSSEMAVSLPVQYALAETLGSMGPAARDAVPAILSLLQRTSPEDPRLAIPIAALGKIGDNSPAVVETLIRLYDEPAIRRPAVQLALIDALSRLGGADPYVFERVSEDAFTGRTARVRVAALRATTRFDVDAESAQAIYLLALEDLDPNVRIAACLLLAEHGRPDDIVLDLVHVLSDEHDFARIVAAHCLAGLGPSARAAVPTLAAAAENPANRPLYNITSWHDDEESDSLQWDLFAPPIRALSRSSVKMAVQSALSAIERPVKTARRD